MILIGTHLVSAHRPAHFLFFTYQQSSSNGAPESQRVEGGSLSPETVEEQRGGDGKRAGRDPDARSVSLLEQKRKVVSSSIDVPQAR